LYGRRTEKIKKLKDSVALVNEDDVMCGTMDKLAAHKSGRLHRALSVFIFNTNEELLLQQRASGKYHSGGLWSNTCCSHPRPGENIAAAAVRRLQEEMGMNCELSYAFHFTYRADMGIGFIEHEYDHVFMGITDEFPVINSEEAADFKYMAVSDLGKELNEHPENYSQWLNICYAQVMEHHIKLFEHDPMVD
jgi:isopentenyl-diphosphate delta-isomerase